jgi:hypothetical protein
MVEVVPRLSFIFIEVYHVYIADPPERVIDDWHS